MRDRKHSTKAENGRPADAPPLDGSPARIDPAEAGLRILVVDDDPVLTDSLATVLRNCGYEVATAMSGPEALGMLTDAERVRRGDGSVRPSRPFHVMLTDISLPTMDGPALLKRVREKHPEVSIIVLTSYGTIESAVDAIKAGAFEYLTHPIAEKELLLTVEKAARQSILICQNNDLKRQLDGRFGLDSIVGSDPRMLRVYDLIEAVAPTRTTVLMTGESGTGKSLIARVIHQRSAVASGPFVELSCGSIPETLLESELFGHVKGAFTGAHADKIGRFQAAHKGTLFLDEINSASPGMQLKLLRVLQERRFEPVGSNQTFESEVRIILASNQPLEVLVADGRFRQDLYYRINVVRIELPALRDRIADIEVLAKRFLAKYNAALGRHVLGFDSDVLDALRRYVFPGNVRELEHLIERAVVLSRKPMIALDDLPANVMQNRPLTLTSSEGSHASADPAGVLTWRGESLDESLAAHERRVLLAALLANGWNRQRTADQLGIDRTTLYKKIRHHRLDPMASSRAG